ncbi:MAG: type II secretion system F family protein [Clostridia bacterium]
MRIYRYTAIDASVRRCRGVIEANDTAQFMQILEARGLYCESYRVHEKRDGFMRAPYRMKTGDLVIFCRQMGIMLRAGMQLPVAMAVLSERTTNPDQKYLYERMSERLHTGDMLSGAMEEQGKAFPSMMIQMMAAAEVSGTMDEMMLGLASYYEREKARNIRIKSATTYPIVLLVLLVGMLLAIFTFVMPRLLPIMKGEDFSTGMKILIWVTDFITNRWYVLVLIVAGVVLLFVTLHSIPKVREEMHKLKLFIPVFGKLCRTLYLARFCEAFATLYRSGIRISDALDMSASTIINDYFTRKCSEARAKVDEGVSLSVALSETGLFDGMFISMLHVGEESGEMEEVLTRLASFYDKEGQSAMDRAVDLIQPIFIIAIALLVGSIVITIMTSMYGMYSNMGV